MTASLHLPVLYTETMKYLQPQPGKRYLDATVGYGGHTLGLLKAGAVVVGIDQDQDMLKLAASRVQSAGFADQFTPVHQSFAKFLASALPSSYDGILFDLGVSSYQLDTPERGFSFRFDATLDMRMDPLHQHVTAKELINGLGRKELYELFRELGEERSARRVADAICNGRKLKPITTTGELATLVEKVSPRKGKLHPATKIFQALRMAVNSEREELKAALPSALSALVAGGVLAVISFHSLEDKIVKNFFVESGQELTVKNPVTPSLEEVMANPRSRSAKLRVLRKVNV